MKSRRAAIQAGWPYGACAHYSCPLIWLVIKAKPPSLTWTRRLHLLIQIAINAKHTIGQRLRLTLCVFIQGDLRRCFQLRSLDKQSKIRRPQQASEAIDPTLLNSSRAQLVSTTKDMRVYQVSFQSLCTCNTLTFVDAAPNSLFDAMLSPTVYSWKESILAGLTVILSVAVCYSRIVGEPAADPSSAIPLFVVSVWGLLSLVPTFVL